MPLPSHRPIINDDKFYADEAKELHEYLDNKNIPYKIYSVDGQFLDLHGTYYFIPLILIESNYY